jgi:hypothetical protein
MAADARKVHRILAVQRQLYRIEEWKLADLRRRLEDLEAGERGLIGALNEDDALQGLFLDALARRLRVLAEEAAGLGEEAEARTARLLEHAARRLCAERLAETADRRARQAAGKRELADIIERVAAHPAQASRKIGEG